MAMARNCYLEKKNASFEAPPDGLTTIQLQYWITFIIKSIGMNVKW
jgi:hypothetical protein